MTTLADYILDVQELIHDTGAVDFTTTELTRFINGARKRTALDTHCVRKFYTGINLVALQETYPLTGGIGGFSNLVGGSGFTGAASVSISAPPAGGTQATATATVTSGAVTALSITAWGLGYTSTPTVTITGAGGSGASATAVNFLNVIDVNSITAIWPGSLQSAMLGWLPFTMFQAFCRSNRLTQSYPKVWTTFEEQNLVYVYPIPDQAYAAEIDAITLTTDMSATTDVENQVFSPYDDCVPYYAAYRALLKMQNFDHAAYFEKKYQSRVTEIIQTRRARRIPSPYRNAARRINRW